MFRPITFYYAATAVFLILDYVFNLNIRVTFFDSQPLARALYYAVCFGCLALMIWRPAWSDMISATESLVVVSALILGMGMRVIVVDDAMLESGRGVISGRELANFLISGTVGYLSFLAAIRSLKRSKR